MPKSKSPEENLRDLLSFLEKQRSFVPPADVMPDLQLACSERQRVLKLSSVKDYVKFLQSHPSEINVFFDTLYGSRCSFFEDAKDSDLLQTLLLPQLQKRRGNREMRFWIVNCGTGQDAYCLAVLLCEFFGEKTFQERVKIFSTDADEDALQRARGAKYSAKDLAGLPEDLRPKYFSEMGDRFVFRNGLRSSLTFGRHIINEDPVMSRMDLILCRHVLIYYAPRQQSQIIQRMSAALRTGGWLLLGRGEEPAAEPPLSRIPSDSVLFSRGAGEDLKSSVPKGGRFEDNDADLADLYAATCEHSPIATICLDNEQRLAIANARARITFGLLTQDLGRPLKDLEISYRPVDLRTMIDQCAKTSRPVSCDEIIHHAAPGRTQMFLVRVYPLLEQATQKREGFTIQFNDVTELYDAKGKLTTVNQQLQTANEELQSSHEELETTNEELQSSNEELETANEELQSTNEELETMNEELHSTNSELEAANTRQRELADSVERNGGFLNSILSSMKSALIVLDDKLEVMLWNDQCRNLWGLRADEVKGHSLFALDIGLPVDALKTRLRQFLQSKSNFDQLTLDATNRRGKDIRCVVSMTPFVNPSTAGVVLLIDEVEPNAAGSRGKQ